MSQIVIRVKNPAANAGKAAVLARLMGLAVAVAPLLGCGVLGLGGGVGGGGPSTSACEGLRPIDRGALPAPDLDDGQRARQEEVCQFLLQEQQAAGWNVAFTSQTPLGQIWDWVDASSVQGADAEPPPAPTLEELQAQLPEGAQLAHMEIEDYPDLQGPAGTIPFLRPDFWAYVAGGTGATSLLDWLDNYQILGSPSNPDRLYAGVRSVVENVGVSANINPFGGVIEDATLACHEMVVGCRGADGEMLQLIGVAAIRDNANEKAKYFMGYDVSSVLRLGVEFYSEGPRVKDPKKGGWAGVLSMRTFEVPKGGFRKFGPGAFFSTSTISTVGGIQYESVYEIRVKDGNWWVRVNDTWIGYYPVTVFQEAAIPTNLANLKACEVMWYGEVYDRTPASWTTTPMGSGHFASEGWSNAAYFRDLQYTPSLGAAPAWPPPNVTEDVPGSNDACYTKTPLTLGAAPWNWYFYADGPGGAAPACTGPLP